MNYKGYEIRPIINGINAVYRDNKLVTVEPNMQVTTDAINRRIYSNPDFNEARYKPHLDKIKKEKKVKPIVVKTKDYLKEKEYEKFKDKDFEVEVVRGKDKEKTG
jgi:hypothetical protein